MKKLSLFIALTVLMTFTLAIFVAAYQHDIDSVHGVTFGGTLYTSNGGTYDSAYASTSRNSTSYEASISVTVTITPYNTTHESQTASASSPEDGESIVTTDSVTVMNADSASSSHSMTIDDGESVHSGDIDLWEEM